MSENFLVQLQKSGQSIWYDNVRRALIDNGDLATKIKEDDLRGVTSNPAIFEKAIVGSTDYDQAMRELIAAGKTVDEIYEALVIDDIQRVADLLKPVYDRTNRIDGYVSLEVSPLLAHDTENSIAQARRLWSTLNRQNVMIKIPATPAGIPAIRTLIAEGININVTLIFSEDTYNQVAEAYISGLEQRHAAGDKLDHVASVASVFVSRVDTLIDSQLEFRARRSSDASEKAALTGLLGKAAIANIRLLYQRFKETFSTDRFATLKAAGAQIQRPLWASTGTKNPAYPDTRYVTDLIAPHTVSTIPEQTLEAVADHGVIVGDSITGTATDAQMVLDEVRAVGVDLEDVFAVLENDGVAKFAASWRQLLDAYPTSAGTAENAQSRRGPGL